MTYRCRRSDEHLTLAHRILLAVAVADIRQDDLGQLSIVTTGPTRQHLLGQQLVAVRTYDCKHGLDCEYEVHLHYRHHCTELRLQA